MDEDILSCCVSFPRGIRLAIVGQRMLTKTALWWDPSGLFYKLCWCWSNSVCVYQILSNTLHNSVATGVCVVQQAQQAPQCGVHGLLPLTGRAILGSEGNMLALVKPSSILLSVAISFQNGSDCEWEWLHTRYTAMPAAFTASHPQPLVMLLWPGQILLYVLPVILDRTLPHCLG